MAEAVKKANFFQKMLRFFKEVKAEMKKVAWPTWSQTLNNTAIVLVVIIIVGIFLAIIDAVFGGVVRGVVLRDFGKAFSDALNFGF